METHTINVTVSLPPLDIPLIISNINPSGAVWSNFEIADMDFWRGPAYTAFFNYLDSKGGFYYEVRLHPYRHLVGLLIQRLSVETALGGRTGA